MIEQQVGDRFREAVAGEPPLGFDPDDVIDRAIKRSRRRKVVWVVAAATVVEAVVVWAVASIAHGGSGGAVGPASGPVPDPAPPTTNYRLSAFEERMTADVPVLVRPEKTEVLIAGLVVRNPDGDVGSVKIMRGDQVLEDIGIHPNTGEAKVNYPDRMDVQPGVPVTLAVHCVTSANQCQGVDVVVSGYLVEKQG